MTAPARIAVSVDPGDARDQSRRRSAEGLCAATLPDDSLRTRYCGSAFVAATSCPSIAVRAVSFRSTTPYVRPWEVIQLTRVPFRNVGAPSLARVVAVVRVPARFVFVRPVLVRFVFPRPVVARFVFVRPVVARVDVVRPVPARAPSDALAAIAPPRHATRRRHGAASPARRRQVHASYHAPDDTHRGAVDTANDDTHDDTHDDTRPS